MSPPAGSRLGNVRTRTLYASVCARSYECSIDAYEKQYELELEDCWQEGCRSADMALAAIGDWALTTTPVDQVTDMASGVETFLLIEL